MSHFDSAKRAVADNASGDDSGDDSSADEQTVEQIFDALCEHIQTCPGCDNCNGMRNRILRDNSHRVAFPADQDGRAAVTVGIVEKMRTHFRKCSGCSRCEEVKALMMGRPEKRKHQEERAEDIVTVKRMRIRAIAMDHVRSCQGCSACTQLASYIEQEKADRKAMPMPMPRHKPMQAAPPTIHC